MTREFSRLPFKNVVPKRTVRGPCRRSGFGPVRVHVKNVHTVRRLLFGRARARACSKIRFLFCTVRPISTIRRLPLRRTMRCRKRDSRPFFSANTVRVSYFRNCVRHGVQNEIRPVRTCTIQPSGGTRSEHAVAVCPDNDGRTIKRRNETFEKLKRVSRCAIAHGRHAQ